MVDEKQLTVATGGDIVPVDEKDIERLLQDVRRQLTRLEQVQDKQADQQQQVGLSVARLQQMMSDRGASCPWRVEISEALTASRNNITDIDSLVSGINEIKIKVATIAAGGGIAGGVAVEIVRALITAAQGKPAVGEVMLEWLRTLFA